MEQINKEFLPHGIVWAPYVLIAPITTVGSTAMYSAVGGGNPVEPPLILKIKEWIKNRDNDRIVLESIRQKCLY